MTDKLPLAVIKALKLEVQTISARTAERDIRIAKAVASRWRRDSQAAKAARDIARLIREANRPVKTASERKE